MTALPPLLGLAAEHHDTLIAGLLSGVEAASGELGMPTLRVADAAGEARVPVLLAIGYPGFYPDLMARRRAALRTLWYGENLPPVDSHTPVARFLRSFPSARAIDLLIGVSNIGGRTPDGSRLLRLRERAAVEREWARNRRGLAEDSRLFDRIVVTSHDRHASALEAGIAAGVAPFGYHERFAGPIQPADRERDLDVVVIGSDLGSPTRRGSLLRAVARRLQPAVKVTLAAGLYDIDRDRLLGRAKVVLDIHRVPGNFNGLRFLFAAAAGAVLVSEPCADPRPLIPAVHYVEAAPEALADAVREVLADEHRRRRIVAAGQHLLGTELAMTRILERVLGG